MDNPERKMQIVYFSHGGGPLPILGDPGHQAMVDFMQLLPEQIHRPEAILVVSAHWEEPFPTLLSARQPPLFYDYYGFPPAAYQITYPAPGHPALAQQVADLLVQHGVTAQLDDRRGFDHGVFIPLRIMYPQADIPVTQLSLIRGLSPAAHLELGKALRDLHTENILLVGSGFSFHNMNVFFRQPMGASDPANDAFQDWLKATCAGALSPAEIEARLVAWEKAPAARYCHPREEHLLPLHVCFGAAGRPGEVVFDDQILGKRSLAILWR